MTYAQRFHQPHVVRVKAPEDHVEPRVAAQASTDPRVAMVLAVLGGRRVEHVAQDWSIEPSLLHRWVRDFLVAGSAVVTNQPDPDQARQRDRFLAAFAHELRTPVAVARGWAMVLEEGDVPADEVAGAMDHLSKAIGRLADHVQDVDMAAAVSLGRLRVNLDALTVADLCRGLPLYDAVRLGGDVTVVADPQLFLRVLGDLWSTAHREPEPVQVAIEVVEGDAWVDVRVVREGVAIGPMTLQALFDPFGANDDASGVTMGLYVARALTVAHGGILAAEGDDDRTVLIARLPRREPSRSIQTDPPGVGDQGGNP
ncbi:MAG: HAMP domain-containing histidine kinase [Microbacterium sp.]|nr:MAG: HAMP domain-containing histidine kinase [Microbacterium sp.]